MDRKYKKHIAIAQAIRLFVFVCSFLLGFATLQAQQSNLRTQRTQPVFRLLQNSQQVSGFQFISAFAGGSLFIGSKGIAVVWNNGSTSFRQDIWFASTPLTRVDAHAQVAAYKTYSESGEYTVAEYSSLRIYEAFAGVNLTLRWSGTELEWQFEYSNATTSNQQVSLSLPLAQVASLGEFATAAGSIQFRTQAQALSRQQTKNNNSNADVTLTSFATADGTTALAINKAHNAGNLLSVFSTFAGYMGGSAADSVTAVYEHNGDVYVCGVTTSSNLPTTSGVFQQNAQGAKDAWVGKFSKSGSKTWVSYFGASGDDIATGICVSNQLVAVSGYTTSQSGLTTSGVLQATYGGGSTDGFVATFNASNGSRNAATYIGTAQNDSLFACTIAQGNAVAVVGTSDATSGFPMSGFQTENGGLTDAILFVCNEQLTARTWATYVGSIAFERGLAITSTTNGNIIVAGTTTSPTVDESIAFNCTEGQERKFPPDVFMTSFTSSGQRNWGRYYGGNKNDEPSRLFAAPNAGFFLCGRTASPNTSEGLIASGNAASTQFLGGALDGFVARFNADGSRVWGSYVGGSGDDRCTGVAVAPNGDVFVSGATNSTDFPANYSDETKHAGYDAFMQYISADGSRRIASMIVGGNGDDIGAGVARFSDNTTMLIGSTSSTDIQTKGAQQNSNAGATDMFMCSFADLSIVGVQEQESAQTGIAPNPAESSLTISNLPSDCQSIRVFTLLGEEVVSVFMQAGIATTEYTIPLAHIARGTYIVEVRTTTQTRTQMFVKQ